MFIRGVQSHSCDWLKHPTENGGTLPTVVVVRRTFFFRDLRFPCESNYFAYPNGMLNCILFLGCAFSFLLQYFNNTDPRCYPRCC